MSDQYKDKLQHDTRLLSRNLRNHLISEGQIKELQSSFSDSLENARWLRQDGTPCDEAEEKEMIRLHTEGWDEILTGKQS